MASASAAPEATPTTGAMAHRIEERREPRYTLLLRQAKLRSRDAEFLCVIRDVSISGLRIRTFHPLPADSRFAIELREGCPYPIEKVWEQDGEAGFRFRNAVALDDLLRDDERYPRLPMRVTTDMPIALTSDGQSGKAHLTNLSQQGARLETDRFLARGQLIRLEAQDLPMLHAKVRWRRDFTHGVVFEETFAFRDFAYLLARLHCVV